MSKLGFDRIAIRGEESSLEPNVGKYVVSKRYGPIKYSIDIGTEYVGVMFYVESDVSVCPDSVVSV